MSRIQATAFIVFVASAATSVFGSPVLENDLVARRDVQNIVYVTDANKFCGGMETYCSPAGRYSPQQGQLPPDFWRSVEFKTGNGTTGARYAQLTGCIRPEKLSRLNPDDAGGQYDSSGGASGNGNPQGSICLGYNHYVELVEPRGPRACIKCCDDPNDCPTNKDTRGCPVVIPGNYYDCD